MNISSGMTTGNTSPGMAAGRKIKMIQVTHDLNIGGLQRLVVDISKNLDKSRYQVTVCALREGGVLEQELRESGIEVIKLVPPFADGTDYLTFWKLYRIFRKERPDIIHTHNSQPFIEGGMAALLARVPAFVHTEHGRHFPDKRRYMFAERVMSHFASCIVAVSDSAGNDLVTYEKIAPEKIRTVMNGIDGGRFRRRVFSGREEKLGELGIRGYDFILGFAGRLAPEKGLIHLLKAMRRLADGSPDKKILLLIAGEGSMMDELTGEAGRLGLEGSVRFLGPRLDMDELMGTFDVFVLPSLREGLPLVLLEAAAAGLPIVATRVGGNGFAVKDGLNGYLVGAGDDAALYNALRALLGDREKIRKFGESSREIFDNNFSIGKMMGQYLKIYEESLPAKGGF